MRRNVRSCIACYQQPDVFRSRVIMQRHGFGRGEYQYFDYPLPALMRAAAHRLYVPLAQIANRWSESAHPRTALSGNAARIPAAAATRRDSSGPRRCCCATHPATTTACIRIYTVEHVFPLQATVLLSSPGEDFEGGELC